MSLGARRVGGAVGRREHAHRVGSPERPHHRGRVLDVAAGDQMLQQRQARVVERDVWGSLRGDPGGGEHAGQGNRDEERADWCVHRGER